MGIQLNGNKNLYTLQFADDQVLLAEDKEDLEYKAKKIKEEYEKYRMTIIVEKTKYLCVGSDGDNLILNGNEIIQCCKEYEYLGVILNQEATNDKEIRARTTHVRKAIGSLNGIFWDHKITKKMEIHYL
jgi:hypothetical protein